MDTDTRKRRVDEDGVSVVEKSGADRVSRARLVVALVTVIVTLSAIAVVVLRREPGPRAEPEASAPPVQEQQDATRPVVAVARRPLSKPPAVQGDQVADRTRSEPLSNPITERDSAASAAAEQERQLEAWARNLIEGLRASGETGGIAAFPPPGTNPVKSGLVVPEDFELPQGYVRHYQVTDDGQRLEPILMFSPDYQFVDDNGQAIALPEDGIVPSDMAPPGLPLRTLELPKAPGTTAAGSGGDTR
jgi:hypothetical protein